MANDVDDKCSAQNLNDVEQSSEIDSGPSKEIAERFTTQPIDHENVNLSSTSDPIPIGPTKNLSHIDSEKGPTKNDSPNNDGSLNEQPKQTTSQVSMTNYVANIEQQLTKSKRDLECMVIKYARSERENLQLKAKVDEFDKKLKRAIKDNDSLANRIKLLSNDKSHLTESLNAKIAQLTVLEQKNLNLNNLQGVKQKGLEEKIVSLEKKNDDLLKQIESYKKKEGELLDFSERLSMKHMLLQSELEKAIDTKPEFKVQYEEVLNEKKELAKTTEELCKQVVDLTHNLKLERDCSENLIRERANAEVSYQKTVDELRNEIKVLLRKHQLHNREMAKQVKQLQSELQRYQNTQIEHISAIS